VKFLLEASLNFLAQMFLNLIFRARTLARALTSRVVVVKIWFHFSTDDRFVFGF
jgi:hypothetical protein